MAKVVIAGRSDCPYFSRVELLGDRLVKNLPSFQLHKIVKTPEEWECWLDRTCQSRGWEHSQSPIVWRELIDRGGKGVLIGGASEFQEYVKGYYGLESSLVSSDMKQIASENRKTKTEIDAEIAQYKALSKPLHVCITAADSPACYSIMTTIASGEVFGPNTEINIRLLDNTDKDSSLARGLAMETQDLCEGLVRGVEVMDDTAKAFRDCSAIIILDELLRTDEESHADWIHRNCDAFTAYGQHINDGAMKNVRVLVAGNGPVNFNTMILIHSAPKIPRQNIVGLSRGVENRAKSVIGQRLNVNTAGVVDLIVWGNVNGKHFIDNSKSRVHGYDGAIWGPPSYSVPVLEMVHDSKWMEKEYLEQVEQRRSAVETALGHSSAGSAARAITSFMTHWWNGSPKGQMFSLAVASDGWYNVPEDLVFSFPVTLSPKGYWIVVQDIEMPEDSKHRLEESVAELKAEMEVIFPPPPAPPVEEEKHETSENETEAKAKETEGTIPEADDTKAEADDTKPEADDTKAEADDTKPEADDDTKPEADDDTKPKPEADDTKPEADDTKPKPEADDDTKPKPEADDTKPEAEATPQETGAPETNEAPQTSETAEAGPAAPSDPEASQPPAQQAEEGTEEQS
ncbi:putative malate dehydrogenase 1B [Babylonia areolata]|uniref:putative malate dehydrogenase 1B n=1 Tax=Babylonia areolata TaxID=304850 RepID=UPI003FD37D8B